jgi:sialate O-acetylesterase
LAQPNVSVLASIACQNQTATAGSDRAWKVTLFVVPANDQLQMLNVSGKSDTLTLENVLIGDVWVLGGQSNIEHPIGSIAANWKSSLPIFPTLES